MTQRDEVVRELKSYFTDDKRWPSTSWNSLADWVIADRETTHKELFEALKALNELCEHYQLSPLAAACKYGDNYEPPTEEECRKVYVQVNEVLKKQRYDESRKINKKAGRKIC